MTFDYENRLVGISGGTISASFVYDADGNRVKGTINGETTIYIAGIYEYSPGGSGAVNDLTLANQTISGTETHEATNTITAGPSLTIASSADVTLISGGTISLQPGFQVLSGASFHAQIGGVSGSGRVTKYYEGNAMRRSGYGSDDGVFYILRDHASASSAQA